MMLQLSLGLIFDVIAVLTIQQELPTAPLEHNQVNVPLPFSGFTSRSNLSMAPAMPTFAIPPARSDVLTIQQELPTAPLEHNQVNVPLPFSGFTSRSNLSMAPAMPTFAIPPARSDVLTIQQELPTAPLEHNQVNVPLPFSFHTNIMEPSHIPNHDQVTKFPIFCGNCGLKIKSKAKHDEHMPCNVLNFDQF